MSKTTISRLTIVVVLVAIILAIRTLPVGEWLVGIEDWVSANPATGRLAYLLVTIISGVALTPGWIPMMLAGLLFGLLPGIIFGLLGTTLGATAAMLTGRTLARSWVEKRIAGNQQLLALDDALDEQAFTIVALTRVALVIPFNILNYAYGLTRVRLPVYMAATAVGMLPVVALYAYLGTLARDITQILSGDATAGPGAWWIAAIAVVAISIIIFVVRRTVIRALERKTATSPDTKMINEKVTPPANRRPG